MDKIILDDLHFWGVHGVYDEEKKAVQEFAVSLTLELDLTAASLSDDLADTLDYARLTAEIRHIVEDESYELLEKLAGRLAQCALADQRVNKVTVGVKKCRAKACDYQFAPQVVLTRGRA